MFCGATEDLNKEHVWPDWLNKVLPNVVTSRVTMTLGGKTWSWVESEPASQKIGKVCEDCNGGWMCRLEAAVKPILVPMLCGRKQTLEGPQQRILAEWAFKTAIVGEHYDPPNVVVPSDQRSWLRTQGKPPPLARVFIAGIDDRWGGNLRFDNHRLIPDAPRHGKPVLEDKRYVATLVAKYVALQVLWNVEDPQLVHQAPLARSVQRIWPFERNFTWPPGPVIPADGLDTLINHFRVSAK